jgi:glucose-1-phosphate thymidylyltransferase
MKGIVLCGGLGTRMGLLTKTCNKHLLGLYNKPMVYFPIQTLVDCGIKDIIIVTGGRFAGDFLQLLGNGEDFGLKSLAYCYQQGNGGIAEALSLTEHLVDGDSVCAILGDNIYEDSSEIEEAISLFNNMSLDNSSQAVVLLKAVSDPERFGVPMFCTSESKTEWGLRITKIIEKPNKFISNYAVTGCYIYSNDVYDICKTLTKSDRGELEITDVNNAFAKRKQLYYKVLNKRWIDAGTPDSMLEAAQMIKGETRPKYIPVYCEAPAVPKQNTNIEIKQNRISM